MENLKNYKVQVYGLDMETIKWEELRHYDNDLEAITELYKELALFEFNIYIFRQHETNKNEWIKVAKIY